MNINFHYYTIKVLANYAGFNEDEAQRIAEYSQFVDDFHPFRENSVDINSVPNYARYLCKKYGNARSDNLESDIEAHIYLNSFRKDVEFEKRENKESQKDNIGGNGWVFYPVNTGFAGLDYLELLHTEVQTNVVVPFHFIPSYSINQLNKIYKVNSDDRMYVTKSFDFDDNTNNFKLRQLLNTIKSDISNPNKKPIAEDYYLIKIGILLHIFADTYSHQRFSGFYASLNWCLPKPVSTFNRDIINTNSIINYWDDRNKKRGITQFGPIGHMLAWTAPDETEKLLDIYKTRESDDQGLIYEYKRDNTLSSKIAAKNIYKFLISLKKKEFSIDEWKKIDEKLHQAFKNNPNSDEQLQLRNWSNQFNTEKIDFSYDSSKIEDATKNKNFYLYNVVADEIRRSIIGEDVMVEKKRIMWKCTLGPEWQWRSGSEGTPGFIDEQDKIREGSISLPSNENYWYPCIDLILQGVCIGNAYVRYFNKNGKNCIQAIAVAQNNWIANGNVVEGDDTVNNISIADNNGGIRVEARFEV